MILKFTRKQHIEEYQEKGRILMIYGPRRIGKTTLLKKYLDGLPSIISKKYDTGDDIELQNLFNSQIRSRILEYASPYDVVAIDEAQNIKNIGVAVKMIIDEFPEKKIILTGSSSFSLAQQAGEPLVGRQYVSTLLPLSWGEFIGSNYEKKQSLENLMIYGAYPEVLLEDNNLKKQYKLQELVSSYLLKDILILDKIKSPELLLNILKALAYQIGSEVSLTKLAKDVGEDDHKKISRYLDILEKTFVIKKIKAFSNNPRNEITKKSKYYFYDLGVRNAVIGAFNDFIMRSPIEIGQLFENFYMMEQYKKSNIERRVFDEFFFWRNKQGKEIDIVIRGINNEIQAFECKWSDQKINFSIFKESYPTAQVDLVHRDNFEISLLN
jgi:predicted AAA+ superfamily ATPase